MSSRRLLVECCNFSELPLVLAAGILNNDAAANIDDNDCGCDDVEDSVVETLIRIRNK
jgi:hypothetical protein